MKEKKEWSARESIRSLNEFLISRGLPPSKPGKKTGSVIIVKLPTEKTEKKNSNSA